MYELKIKTPYNTIELIVDDFFSEEVQEIIHQPYIQEIYLRCIDYENLENYKNIKKMIKKGDITKE